MPKRPPGRPKAAAPRNVFVGLRLTEEEADLLYRMAGQRSLSAAFRHFLQYYATLWTLGGVPDTPRAMIARELRKAKRTPPPDGPDLAHLFALEEDVPPPTPSPPGSP